jgi:hypothetical protein
MRNGFFGLTGGLVAASMLVAAGCSSSANGASGVGGSTGGGVGGSAAGGSNGTGGSNAADAGGGTAVTPIMGSKTLGSLTAAQATQLCNDTSAYFGRNITKAQACKFAALTFSISSSAPTEADLRIGCTNTETSCNQSDASTGIAIMCSAIPASCAATVAQYSSCVVDQSALYRTNLAALPACSALTRADFDKITMSLPNANPPASCEGLMSSCPDLTLPFPGV